MISFRKKKELRIVITHINEIISQREKREIKI